MLTKQLCLIKITQLKQVIATKSYSQAMLHLPHTKYSYHVQPQFQPSNWFILFNALQLFNSCVIHECKPWIQHYGGIRYNDRGYVGRQKWRKSHINEANQRAMEMPINRYQHEVQGLPCNECTKSYKCMEAHYENYVGVHLILYFNQYMKVITQETLYHEDHGATLKHKCGKKDSSIVLLSFLSFFYLAFLFFFIWDNALLMMIITLLFIYISMITTRYQNKV